MSTAVSVNAGPMLANRYLRISAATLGVLMTMAPLYPARAQSEATRYLKVAERLYEELEYERALEQLAQARRQPRSLSEDVRIAIFEGLILADMGRSADARIAFRTSLMLDPDAQIPVRVSPKVKRDFEQIREQIRKEQGLQGNKPQETPAPKVPEARADLTEQQAPPAAPQVERTPEPESPPWMPSPVRKESRLVPTHSLVLLGAGVVAGGVGGFFGLRSRGQLKEARAADYHQEMAYSRSQSESNARVANVLFGTAGVLATSAVVSWLLSRSEEAHNAEASR